MGRYDINFLPSQDIHRADRALNLKKMDGFWPTEIALNWLMPEHLHILGYPYSIKIDYDMLCVAAYDDILKYWPWDVAYAAVHVNVKSWPTKAFSRVNKSLRLRQAKTMYANAGFVIFNNAICHEVGFYDRFESASNLLIESTPEVGLREQVALAMVSASMPAGINKVPSRYNHRIPRYRRETEDDPALVNIHYIGKKKPWHALDQVGVEALVQRGRGISPFFSPVWLEFASSIDDFSEYCQVQPYTAMQVLELARDVVNESDRLLKRERRETRLLRERLKELGDESGLTEIAA